jgi:uncharacterized membrane protein
MPSLLFLMGPDGQILQIKPIEYCTFECYKLIEFKFEKGMMLIEMGNLWVIYGVGEYTF